MLNFYALKIHLAIHVERWENEYDKDHLAGPVIESAQVIKIDRVARMKRELFGTSKLKCPEKKKLGISSDKTVLKPGNLVNEHLLCENLANPSKRVKQDIFKKMTFDI